MIRTIKDKETSKVYNGEFSKNLPHDIQRRALTKLILMDNAEKLEDLAVPPSNHLESLSGERKGQYSIRINDQYRICFTVKDNEFYDIEIVDYH